MREKGLGRLMVEGWSLRFKEFFGVLSWGFGASSRLGEEKASTGLCECKVLQSSGSYALHEYGVV